MENIKFPMYYEVPIAVQENGERGPPPYPQRPPPYLGQLFPPPPYPGKYRTPPPYPGKSSPQPAYPGLYFSPINQPYHRQSESVHSCVVQPMGVNRSNMHRLYCTQPCNPGNNSPRHYPVQNGRYTPYPNVSQPHYGPPSQVYMNHSENLPGTRRRITRRQGKGFVRSLMAQDNVITEDEFSFWAEKLMNNPEEIAALENYCKENFSEENDANERKGPLYMLEKFVSNHFSNI